MTHTNSNLKRWLPGALISAALIAVILYFVDLRETLNAIRNANYLILSIAMASSFAWITVRAIVWRTLLRERASYRDVLFTVGEGYLLNNFLPFRLGEIGRAFLLSRKSDLKFGEILPTIVIERVVDLGFTAAILLAALPFVVKAEGADRIGIIVGVIVVVGLGLMYILARNNRWALDLFHRLSGRFPSLQRVGGDFLETFFAGLGVLTDGRLFARFLFWMTINWGIAIVNYYIMIRAVFPNAQWSWAMLGIGFAAFGGAIPGLPGSVGTLDGAITFALTLVSGNESASLAVALITRLYNYLNSGVIGGIGLAREGQTLSGVYKQLMNMRNKTEES